MKEHDHLEEKEALARKILKPVLKTKEKSVPK
jgi:hypothetical protein